MDVNVVQVAPGVWHARAKHVGWVLVTDGDAVTLVDSGYPGDRERVQRSLVRIGRTPADVAAVLLTHAHPDHLGSAEYFRSCVSAPVLVHEAGEAHAMGRRIEQVSPFMLLRHAWRPSVMVWLWDVIALKAQRVERVDEVNTFAGPILDVPGQPRPVHTPGHTSGHCAFHLPDRGVLLAGDALMTDHALVPTAEPQLLPGFFNLDAHRARASLRLLADLDAEAVVPGHGAAFLGSPADAVRAALASGAGHKPLRTPQAVQISYDAALPIPPVEAFAFVSDPRNWPRFIDNLRSADPDDDWAEVGGRGHMTTRFLGRTIESTMEITVWDPPREFRYTSRQPGAPDLDNHRVFEAIRGGTRLRGTTEAMPAARDGARRGPCPAARAAQTVRTCDEAVASSRRAWDIRRRNRRWDRPCTMTRVRRASGTRTLDSAPLLPPSSQRRDDEARGDDRRAQEDRMLLKKADHRPTDLPEDGDEDRGQAMVAPVMPSIADPQGVRHATCMEQPLLVIELS